MIPFQLINRMVLMFKVIILLVFVAACSESPVEKLKVLPGVNIVQEKTAIDLKAVGLVDILFVVDDSSSMSIHQNNLAENIRSYTQILKDNEDIDFRIAVITSDMDSPQRQGRFRGSAIRVVTRSGDFESRIQTLLRAGENGSFEERFADAIKDALSPELLRTHNRNFLREEAPLAIFLLTDTDDYSRTTIEELRQHLVDLKGGNSQMVSISGAMTPANSPETCLSDDSRSVKLTELVLSTRGQVMSLCSPNFGENLASIGSRLRSGLNQFFPLKSKPVLSSIVVKIGQVELPNDPSTGWTYDPNRIVLIIGPEVEIPFMDDAAVEVTYEPLRESKI